MSKLYSSPQNTLKILTLPQIRSVATSSSSEELSYNISKGSICFRCSVHIASGTTIIVYARSMTCNVILPHTRLGKTSIFVPYSNKDELRRIFTSPRTVTGYKYVGAIGEPPPRSTVDLNEGEESALRNQLGRIDRELAELQREREEVAGRLEVFEGGRREKEEREAEKAFEKEKNAEEEELQRMQKGWGDKIHCHPNFLGLLSSAIFTPSCKCLALSGSSTGVCVNIGGDYSSTEGLGQEVHENLGEGNVSFIALGSRGRCYIKYTNGDYVLDGTVGRQLKNDLGNPDLGNVLSLSFGSSRDSYFLLLRDSYTYCDIPAELETAMNSKTRTSRRFFASSTRNLPVDDVEDARIVRSMLPRVVVRRVSLGPCGEYFVRWSDGDYQLGSQFEDVYRGVEGVVAAGGRIENVLFGERGTFVIRYSEGGG